jgi:hypothetical protein
MTRRNIKLGFIVTISLLLPLFQFKVVRAVGDTTQSKVVINELQVNGVGTGTTAQEFIELKNSSTSNADISGWKLQYISSTGNLATAKYFVTFPDNTVIYPGGFLLVTPDSFLPLATPKVTYAITSSFSGLAASGGTVALVNDINVTSDLVGWGTKTTTICETLLAAAPADGASIQRKVVDGITQDTDNNQLDFEAQAVPTPQTDNAAPAPPPAETPPPTDTTLPVDTPPPVDTTPPADTITPPTDTSTPPPTDTTTTDTPPTGETTGSPSYSPILLNEFFIDPVSPLTDANDEWVELYNPNNTEQNLAGYTVYAGTTYAYHHTFTANDTIASHGYIVITSGTTSIALSNGGGSVKIVGPTGEVYDETSYDSAPENMAWAKNQEGLWQWTTTPTESGVNVITSPPAAILLVSNASATAKKTATKKVAASSTKTATTKASTAKTATKTTKVLAATDSRADAQLVAAPTPLPLWLLAVLGVLAVLYSGYEYRFDIANKLYQLRNH